jgi:hypothetical protein
MIRSFAAALGALLFLAPSAVSGDDKPKAADKGGVFPVVEEVKKEDEARALVQALEAAVTGKEEEKIVAAVRPMVTKRHADFVPELKKLLNDKRDKVVAAAAEALGSQGNEEAAVPLLKLVSNEERERGFLKYGHARAAAIEAVGRLGVNKAFDSVRKIQESLLNEKEAKATYTKPILRAAIRYFGLTKEKKAVGILVGHFDEPVPENPNSGSNPPEAYWKARHEIWQEIKAEVVWALKEITGKEMESGRRWKNWLDDEGKKEGMK